ncbi:MAG: tRNA (adenosine(37)-N6)-dimethylallyltransferase MiaA [Sandaracinaceae bacterium]|nr:tRNA (adenosine(37)-N6)-dimethylallyltransferase MiaA [Sandaracinaceae bacterium]
MSARIVVVAGVTAAGKTAAAIAIARRRGGELVGADSVQVYRGFDVGSAKPTAAELGEVRHHLIDVADPDAPIDAATYAALADRAIAGILARGRLPIVVGGTGLWLRALVRGLVELPKPDPALRAALEAEAEAVGDAALHARLAPLDPRYAAQIHPHDRRRIVRALEVLAQTGRPLGEHLAEHAKGAPRYATETYLLDRPRAELYARLRARIDAMIAAGWVDEVRAIVARWGRDVRPLHSVGYRQLLAHVEGEVSLEEAARLAYKATRIYTRRQRTWFTGEPLGGAWCEAETLGR